MNKKMKSQQQHTIPRWLLENFTDREGMLHVASNDPRTFFKSKPKNVFRRRDYYAAKEIGESLEAQITKTENLFFPCVKNVLRAAREGIDQGDLSCVKAILDDIRACGLFLLHLAYRSPQWLGEDFFSGMDAIRIELERVGEDMASVIREESTKLIQASELVYGIQSSGCSDICFWRLWTVCISGYGARSGQPKAETERPELDSCRTEDMDGIVPRRRVGSCHERGRRNTVRESNAQFKVVSGLGGSFQRNLRKA